MSRLIVPVIGMHRSGTSAVAGVLHAGGVRMGEERTFVPRPSPENPRGFFEDVRFRRLNDRLLERSGYVVKEWGTSVPVVSDTLLLRLARRRLIRACGSSGAPWGWKDPRTCLVFDLWLRDLAALDLLEGTRVVFVHRHPLTVARSLEKRNSLTPERGLSLWIAYTEAALEALEGCGVERMFMGYEALLAEPAKHLAALAEFLGGAFSCSSGQGVLDQSLERSKTRGSEVAVETSDPDAEEALKLYSRLVGLS